MITVQKYLGGSPSFRQSELQKYLGTDINSTSMWDQCEVLANGLKPVYTVLKNVATDGYLFYTDDTRAQIINKKTAKTVRRGINKAFDRDGCHSSCLISEDKQGLQAVLIKTDIIHAGEWIDEILKSRNIDLPPPMHMADRASCNSATSCMIIDLACNQHARANFKEIENNFKLHCGKVLKHFKRVFANDKKTEKMTSLERFDFHIEYSRPIMEEILANANSVLKNYEVEPNGKLAKAYKYLLEHQDPLLGFTKYENAPLSNNLCERMIKKIVLLRKIAGFIEVL